MALGEPPELGIERDELVAREPRLAPPAAEVLEELELLEIGLHCGPVYHRKEKA